MSDDAAQQVEVTEEPKAQKVSKEQNSELIKNRRRMLIYFGVAVILIIVGGSIYVTDLATELLRAIGASQG